MSGANRDQIEFWERAGRRWVTHQEHHDRMWRPVGDAAIERAAVLPGERVVDVGCGCGDTTLELAATVGPSGSVVGIDVSAPMLARARERAQALGIANLEFVQADASTHAFARPADLVFSRAGVMFFSDAVAAFANLRRALRPGGRLVFVCFRDRALNSWWTVPLDAATAVVAPGPARQTNEPSVFSLADEIRLRAVLDGSGFTGVICEPVDRDLVLGSDVETATEFSIEAGPAANALIGTTNEVRARVRTAIRQSLARHAGSGWVSLHAATWIVRATNF